MEILTKIQKELKVPKSQFNTFGNYHYRSCEDILEAIKPLLGNAILTISDEMVLIGDRYYVKATATLSEGTASISTTAYARESLDKKGMDSAQITGSASSYARKYALNGLFCIEDTKDADTMKHEDTPAVKPTTSKPKESGEGKVCDVCGAEAKLSAKTGNWYCQNWKIHQENGEKYNLIKKGNDEVPFE